MSLQTREMICSAFIINLLFNVDVLSLNSTLNPNSRNPAPSDYGNQKITASHAQLNSSFSSEIYTVSTIQSSTLRVVRRSGEDDDDLMGQA